MKKFLLFAAAAALFAACASDELQTQTQQQTAQDDGAIMFDAYMQRPVTRAGVAGDASLTELKNTATDKLGVQGFGVFGYYTDNFDYTPLYQPNFMYNEQVTWDADKTAFTYTTTKYWPNEHGSAATSADMDRVSFFAYLPYVPTDPSTGMLVDGSGNIIPGDDDLMQHGITGMKRNSLQGDPTIQYIASFNPSQCVDLCWGVANGESWSTNSESTPKTMTAGLPWLNVRKPDGIVGNNTKVNFTFRHALAKLDVNVMTDVTGGWTGPVATKTKIWVRSIRFTGIAQKAALNLNNPKANTARWIDYYGTNELEMGESVTVYDGRKDGSEGVAGAEAINEAVLGLNPEIVQVDGQIESGEWSAGSEDGVIAAPGKKLFGDGIDPASAVYVIPTGEKVNVEIVYDIETIDEKLPTLLSDGETHGSSIENRIIKQAVFNKLESGKSYVLNLKLGLKDVQFTASEFSDWDAGETNDAYLPANWPIVAKGADPTFSVPYDLINFGNLTITGVTASKDFSGLNALAGSVNAATVGSSDATGNLTITGITFTPNNKVVKNTDGKITIDGSGSDKTIISFTQEAAPLNFTITAAVGDPSITLNAVAPSAGVNWGDDVVTPATNITVIINGVKKNFTDSSTPSAGEFSWDAGTITLGEGPLAGTNAVEITVKAGEAAPKTVSKNLP